MDAPGLTRTGAGRFTQVRPPPVSNRAEACRLAREINAMAELDREHWSAVTEYRRGTGQWIVVVVPMAEPRRG